MKKIIFWAILAVVTVGSMLTVQNLLAEAQNENREPPIDIDALTGVTLKWKDI